MASKTAVAAQTETISLTAGGRVRAEAYGGLVGLMIEEIDARMAPSRHHVALAETPEDFPHRVSVVCGYLGLLAGVFATAALLLIVMQ